MLSSSTHCTESRSTHRPAYELADILRRYLPDYLKTHRITYWQHKVLYDIQVCRTAILGGHVEECDHCSYQQPTYDSCHNRNCPKCFSIAMRQWVAKRLQELLPVPYFHLVFTMPHSLNTLALYNKKLIYKLFYQAASYTLLKFGRDPKHLGAQLGFIGVLHTWGKGLCYHIHWHFIVAGGGLTDDGQWLDLPAYDKFIFPVRAMSRVVGARFIKLLRRAHDKGQLIISDACEELNDDVMFEYFLTDLASEKWINYAKRPFGSPEQVVKYVGRYTHRVAISNNRILSIDNGQIRFQVKDYRSGGDWETMALPAELFIHRFVQHIVPKRFRKIRYGGFLAVGVRDEKLAQARRDLDVIENAEDEAMILPEVLATFAEIDEKLNCPVCMQGRMRRIEISAQRSSIHAGVHLDSS